MPARGNSTNRQNATNRSNAVGRLASVNRQNLSGGTVDDMTFLDEVIVGGGGAATVAFNAISGAYRHLCILYVARGDNGANQVLGAQFNGDTGANYDQETLTGVGAGASATGAVASTSLRVGGVIGTGGPTLAFATGEIWFPYYSTTTQDKGALGRYSYPGTLNAVDQVLEVPCGTWRTANAAISSITLFPGAGSFIANTRFSLYGLT